MLGVSVKNVAGRFIMMFSGMYPMDTTMQVIGMVVGTVIAAVFALPGYVLDAN